MAERQILVPEHGYFDFQYPLHMASRQLTITRIAVAGTSFSPIPCQAWHSYKATNAHRVDGEVGADGHARAPPPGPPPPAGAFDGEVIKGEARHKWGPSLLRYNALGFAGKPRFWGIPRFGRPGIWIFHTLASEYSRNRRHDMRFLWSGHVVRKHGSTWVRWFVRLRCFMRAGSGPEIRTLEA
jgi:hypothetical protein